MTPNFSMKFEIARATLYISSFLDNITILFIISFLSNIALFISSPNILIKVSISSAISSSFFPLIVLTQLFKISFSLFKSLIPFLLKIIFILLNFSSVFLIICKSSVLYKRLLIL